MTEAKATLRAAVIGAGAMGRNHVRILSEMSNVELVGVADVDQGRLDEMHRRYRAPGFLDHREMLQQAKPDLVSIVVPSQLHLPVALEVIEAGAHLLVEKPIASTVAEAQTIIEAAVKADVKLMVGHIERFNPAVRALKAQLDDGALGRVFKIQARRIGPFPARVRDVGVVIDLATHDLDLMCWLVGSPVARVYAETARRIHTDHEDLLAGLLRFEDGTVGVLDINWLTPTKVRELAVTGERGMFLVNYLTQELFFYENHDAHTQWDSLGVLTGVSEGRVLRHRVERREPLAAELHAFVDAVAADIEPPVRGEDGLRALSLAHQLVRVGQGEAAGSA